MAKENRGRALRIPTAVDVLNNLICGLYLYSYADLRTLTNGIYCSLSLLMISPVKYFYILELIHKM